MFCWVRSSGKLAPAAFILCIGITSSAYALTFQNGDLVQISSDLNARSQAYYYGHKDVRYVLDPGTRGKIEGIKRFSDGDDGLEISVQNGPHAGANVWVLWTPEHPWLKLLAGNGQAVSRPSQAKTAVTTTRVPAQIAPSPASLAPQPDPVKVPELVSNLNLLASETSAALATQCSCSQPVAPNLTGSQTLTVEQINSILENSTSNFNYSYIGDIGDGAGVTAGRVGFNQSQLLSVVSNYVKAKGGNTPLAAYLPCLKEKTIARNYSCLFPDVSAAQMATTKFKETGMKSVDFGKAWAQAGSDPLMRAAQDNIVIQDYLHPAEKAAKTAGLSSPLAVALIFDTMIQEGNAAPMIKYAQSEFAQAHGGRETPTTSAEEAQWLGYYQQDRMQALSKNRVDRETLPRVEALSQLLSTGNLNLNLPVQIQYFGKTYTLAANAANKPITD